MQKLNNTPTRAVIAAMLRKAILSGAIPDGEELTQNGLAEQLGVSRMPVREALQILEQDGLLLRLPNRHMRVSGMREDTVRDSMRLVAAVESEIISILLHGREPGDFSTLDQLLAESEEQVKQGDVAGMRQSVSRFHRLLSQLTGNPYLIRSHHRLLAIYPQYAWENVELKCPEEYETMLGMLEALKRGKEEQICKAVEVYYRDLGKKLIAQTA